jgi:hypothetical protein
MKKNNHSALKQGRAINESTNLIWLVAGSSVSHRQLLISPPKPDTALAILARHAR